jgi:hypothetical protein
VAHARSAATDLCAAQRGAPPEAAAQDQQQHATQLLAWLGDHANMEARVVQQVASLAPRVAAATGSGVFAGISIVLAGLLEQLPDGVPASAAGCVAALQAAQWPMEALQQLLAAAALSLADALLDRCAARATPACGAATNQRTCQARATTRPRTPPTTAGAVT